jgi:malto-oligosyltrehalose trehalohydrolase
MLPMEKAADGWFLLETDLASEGDLYMYVINGEQRVPDPASRFQPEDVDGPSMIVRDHGSDFKNSNWKGLPWNETVIYELHVGTFTPEGTFEGVERKLDYLKYLGATAIELMPLADFPGRYNWGYDGVLLFAPDSSYGTPDDLRGLIKAAHQRQMMVFLDVVYNHFGPQGNYLHSYAKQFFNEKHSTPWGAAINFDGENSKYVRQFYLQNALYWLTEFQFDGLRFDAVHAIADGTEEHVISEIAKTITSTIGKERQIHLMIENDRNNRSFLVLKDPDENELINAQWNDDIHHALHVIASDESSGYYVDYVEESSPRSPIQHLARCLSEGFAYQGEASTHKDGQPRGEPSHDLPPQKFISFIQNHDQVGNRALGDRLHSLSQPHKLKALTSILLLNPSIPLIFMGQEFDCSAPFYYFCDMEPELGKLIREGRRNEFAHFPEFASEEARRRIPDPLSKNTFFGSKILWHETDKNFQTLEFYRELLNLRKKHIMPLLRESNNVSSEILSQETDCLCVSWTFGQRQVCLLSNLSDSIADLSKHKIACEGETIFSTHVNIKIANQTLPPWCTLWRIANA